jgi:hypothetical protein
MHAETKYRNTRILLRGRLEFKDTAPSYVYIAKTIFNNMKKHYMLMFIFPCSRR